MCCLLRSRCPCLAVLFPVRNFVGQWSKVNKALRSQPRKIQLWKYHRFSRHLQIRICNCFCWWFLGQDLTGLAVFGKSVGWNFTIFLLNYKKVKLFNKNRTGVRELSVGFGALEIEGGGGKGLVVRDGGLVSSRVLAENDCTWMPVHKNGCWSWHWGGLAPTKGTAWSCILVTKLSWELICWV